MFEGTSGWSRSGAACKKKKKRHGFQPSGAVKSGWRRITEYETL